MRATLIEVAETAVRAVVAGARWPEPLSAGADERTATLWVWSSRRDQQGSRLIGSARVRWHCPASGRATIEQLSWDPARGQAADVWRPIERALEMAEQRVGESVAPS